MSGQETIQELDRIVGTTNELLLSPEVKMMDVGGGVMRPTNAMVMANLAIQLGGAMPYTSVELGLAGTVDGTNFSVLSSAEDEYVNVYRNVNGEALYIDSYPNSEKVRALSSAVEDVDSRLTTTEIKTGDVFGRKVPNIGFVVMDSRSGKCLWTDEQGRTNSLSHNTFLHLINGVEQIPQTKRRANGTRYMLCGADGRALAVVRDNGLVELPRLNVTELTVGGKPISHGVSTNLNDTYLRGGELLKYYANPLSFSGWGSSSMERMGSQFSSMISDLEPQASYYNGGKGGEMSTHIAGRLGSIPFQLTVNGGEIPESGGVTVIGSNVLPSASLKPFTGWLNGVHGTVSSTGSVMTFTRTTSGGAVPSVGEFAFVPEIGPQHRGDVVFLWMSKNDVGIYTALEIIERTDASFDWLSPYIKRCLVLGHFHNSDWAPDGALAQKVDAINAAHRDRYGDLFVDVQAYLMSEQVWGDTGITPTPEDLAQQALGQKPASLSADTSHMNEAMYLALNEKILQPLIRQLGWY